MEDVAGSGFVAGTGLLIGPPSRRTAESETGRIEAVGIEKVTLADTAGLMRLYRERIFRYVLFATRDQDVAETLTQDCFLRAFEARAQFRGECAVSTWLTRIAVNLVRDHLRNRRLRFWKKAATVDAAEISERLPDRISTAEERLIARQQVACVWRTVDGLSDKQRSVFLLRFVEELELSEIAEVTGMHLSTVKSHLYRGLTAVRKQLEAQQ
jgi:RNA polymerase sigma-70 factor (ECF subfamily)